MRPPLLALVLALAAQPLSSGGFGDASDFKAGSDTRRMMGCVMDGADKGKRVIHAQKFPAPHVGFLQSAPSYSPSSGTIGTAVRLVPSGALGSLPVANACPSGTRAHPPTATPGTPQTCFLCPEFDGFTYHAADLTPGGQPRQWKCITTDPVAECQDPS